MRTMLTSYTGCAVLCWCVQWMRPGQTGPTGQRALSPAETALILGHGRVRQVVTVAVTVWEMPPSHGHAMNNPAQVSHQMPSVSIS